MWILDLTPTSFLQAGQPIGCGKDRKTLNICEEWSIVAPKYQADSQLYSFFLNEPCVIQFTSCNLIFKSYRFEELLKNVLGDSDSRPHGENEKRRAWAKARYRSHVTCTHSYVHLCD